MSASAPAGNNFFSVTFYKLSALWLRILIGTGTIICYSAFVHCQPLKRLNHLSFNVNEGLLHSQVTDINEDGNGFIWLSTGSGVQRFDGRNFHSVPQSLNYNGIPDDKYVQFFRLRNGNLWLIHSQGISEYDMHTNRFTKIRKGTDSLAKLIPLKEETDGIWFAKPGKGIYFFNKKDFRLTDSFSIPEVSQYFKLIFAEGDKNPSYFVAQNEKIVYVLDRKLGNSRKIVPGAAQQRYLGSAAFRSDTILVATQRGIEKLDVISGKSQLLSPYRTKNPAQLTRHLINLHRVAENTFIIYEGKDIYELDTRTGRYLTKIVDLQNNAFINLSLFTRFFSDSYNNLWLLTENDGIRKINYQTAGFKYFGSPDRGKNFVKSIYVDKEENQIFCGTLGNGLQIFDTSQRLIKKITSFPGAVAPSTVAALIKTGKQEYLVFLMGELKAYYLTLNNYTLKRAKIDTSTFKNVFDYHLNVFPIENDESFLQSSYGVYRIRHTHPEGIRIIASTEVPAATTTSYLDPEKRLWVGGRASYFIFQDTSLNYKAFQLSENILVRCFYRDSKKRFWMGTEKGLYQLDHLGNILKIFYKEAGLPDENIYAIREDQNGDLWFSHNKGISCMKQDGSLINFGKNDGLQENEFNTNTSFETADGELFFGGVNGISSFYPQNILRPYNLPKLLITSIKIGEQEFQSDTASWNVTTINLPHNQNSISFQFTAMGQRNPEQYNYQYRMSGLNETWINSSSTDIARYVLPPGKYQFELSAEKGLGQASSPLKTISIFIHPPFWQTSWFLALIAIAVISIIILITRYLTRIKLKQRILELEQKRSLDEERLRISREMHDDIGAGLTQISMMTEAVRIKDGNKEQLDEIANTSRKLVGNISEIIWSLNPENNTLDQFLGYLREQLHKLLQYSGISYEIDFPENGSTVLLNNAQRRNLLLVTKEIVHNAVKHSRATQILITCKQEPDSLKFIVKDNGCSFDASIKTKGNGLHNIRRRMTELSGNLNIDSSLTKGTTFEYNVSLN